MMIDHYEAVDIWAYCTVICQVINRQVYSFSFQI